jgi:hypothetical protein
MVLGEVSVRKMSLPANLFCVDVTKGNFHYRSMYRSNLCKYWQISSKQNSSRQMVSRKMFQLAKSLGQISSGKYHFRQISFGSISLKAIVHQANESVSKYFSGKCLPGKWLLSK